MWDTETWQESRVDNAHDGVVFDGAWKNNREFATGGGDSLIKFWDLALAEPRAVFKGHSKDIEHVQWDKSGTVLASCGSDNTVKIWIPMSGERPVFDFAEHTGEVHALAWSPTGPGTANENLPLRLATAGSEGMVKLWDMVTGKCIVTFNHHEKPVNAVAFSPNFEYLCSGGNDGTVKLYSTRGHNFIKSLPSSGNGSFENLGCIFGVDWDFESRTIAAASQSGVLLIDTRHY